MMNKKIFICGQIHSVNPNNTADITNKIQKRVDAICDNDERLIGFSVQVTSLSNSELDIELTFKRNNLFAKCGVQPEFVNDSDAQLIMGMDGKFTPPVKWDLVQPFGVHRYNVPIIEFVYAYVESAKALGASEIKGLQIESSKTELKLKIRV